MFYYAYLYQLRDEENRKIFRRNFFLQIGASPLFIVGMFGVMANVLRYLNNEVTIWKIVPWALLCSVFPGMLLVAFLRKETYLQLLDRESDASTENFERIAKALKADRK